ncbi:response regulator transcription factor [Brevibacillus daliensis]|uniref:response regulator transcription factor n=1 Tax=Brevibacillus daliensis TaxID=2892995 RepID=UPI001E6013FD|nr:response regulator transcription factor [Brevibacillus daliensis]
MYKIMIVEDDAKLTNILRNYLERYGYNVSVVTDLKQIKTEFVELEPHLVLLDINLPYYDGFYWCRQIRTISNVPIIFISARVGEMDQVMAIENGGDDYVTKPFSLDVVMAKVKGVLRRVYGEYAGSSIRELREWNGLYLDTAKGQVDSGEKRVFLSKNETLLLDALMQRGGSIVSREELLETLWDDTHFVDDNTLTVNVTRLRKRLEELGIQNAIETCRGQGYRLIDEWGCAK